MANLIRQRKAHRGSRESGVGSGATRGEFNSPTESAPRESGVGWKVWLFNRS
ncbi:hypothetical protein [Moorena sp. SIO3A2]|uniref:hypothetical protein n=1 Tax=Moorena sp. SIO3A2 TaxID=2607841 RepID=UPI0013BCC6B3|nr:hypothetical protein [Moorena sp. SIO3A2]NER88463.1 hypothetical protein [Moorena sp. SIO3A2]